ncbi:MAG: adenylate/guanylate cyclase domain-containing protein [Gammaproteobacteria bacterium]
MILPASAGVQMPLNQRQLVVTYQVAGAIFVALYLALWLQTDFFPDAVSIIGVAILCLAVVSAVSGYRRPEWIVGASTLKNQRRQLDFDLSLYLVAAAVVAGFEAHSLNYAVPLAIRTFAAIVSIGFYVSLAIAFELEYGCIKNNVPVNITRMDQIIPGTFKLRRFLALLLATGLVNIALAQFDFINDGYTSHMLTPSAMGQHFQQLVLLSTLILGVSICLLYLYCRNLFYILGMQINVLRRVEEGSFDVTMPVVSEDESGLLANYHNIMIERLRDRERLYSTLKKSVGKNIMAKLLNTDEQTLKQGQAYDVAILFCDLRGFSSLGESASAEEIILFLNVYFAEVSGVISKHEGIINKFMGDAVLAIFGLESKGGNAVAQAVKAGLEIIEQSANIYMPNAMQPETGVGIHFGSVAAGTIGSDERYEYTVVGDAVNKASRLESLSKRLDYSVILSIDAYERLGNEEREKFVDLGAHHVRGRSEPIHVYGARKKPRQH